MNIEQGNYTVDVAVSTLGWKGSKKVGGSHNGTISIQGGNINIEDGGASGEIVLDMTKISEDTLPDEESKGKLIGHLMSDDFFSVEKFPTATLKIKGIDADDKITADLTIKGITNEIQFPVTFTAADNQITAEASFEIDRTLWDVRFGSGKFFDNLGDALINDEIEITIKIQATK